MYLLIIFHCRDKNGNDDGNEDEYTTYIVIGVIVAALIVILVTFAFVCIRRRLKTARETGKFKFDIEKKTK